MSPPSFIISPVWRTGLHRPHEAHPPSRRIRISVARKSCSRRPRMIQSPNSDGPPDLDDFFDKSRKSVGSVGAPITLSTARALLVNNNNDSKLSAAAALEAAIQNLSGQHPQLVHVTHSPDVDVDAVAGEVARRLPDVPVIGRSVNKQDGEGTIEVLLLRSGSSQGLGFASVSVPLSAGDDASAATESAAKQAATRALNGLGKEDEVTFLLFAHSPFVGQDDRVRRGFSEAKQEVVAYGGPGVGAGESGLGWSVLFGGTGADVEVMKTGADVQTAVVAAVSGSIPFLISSVVKNWAQPAFVAPLAFMKARYVGEAKMDLLTAIRYDDWAKFVWCIEEQGVDVNVRWTEKQNQIPLLAACARARTRMIEYLLGHGADVGHRNDGGFTAAMYTRMLTQYDADLVAEQLRMLEEAGARTRLTEDEREKLKAATNGRIVE